MNRTDPIIVTVLRHGAVAGRAHVFRGVLDEPLTEQGVEQMQQALARYPAAEFDVVATSPLKRCHEFAVAYVAQRHLPLRVLPPFSELAFGDWEGLTPEEATERNPAEYQAFRATGGEHAPPNGESLAQFRARIGLGWQEWLARDDGMNRLLITHAGVMRALLMELFGFTPAQAFQIALPEAACLRVSWLHGKPPFLLSVN
ncbi:alpha-ribazole phosphatase [mine drainage metagenome]|uniref:Alpha-ribazole phosphatase n=1 Tax=mine drainage metagenome TaxID=410659 RepID=A0A1J5U1Y7_9ZZZZ